MRAVQVDRLMEPGELVVSEIDPPDPADDGRIVGVHAIAVQFLEIG